MRGLRVSFLLVASVLVVLTGSAGAQTVSYVYDELGRLIAVTDPAGDTAVYTYDSVGNVLSINRHSSSVLSIIQFTPATGPVGTAVTIYGTAFDPTPGQTSVTFNGTAASVSSASSTTLVVAVPSGATTGLISLTTPGGSTASATTFTVTAGSPGGPTISAVSPQVGAPADPVAISGAGFDSVRANNRVSFNTALAVAGASSTTTEIDTVVPEHGTSGRIAVATSLGEAQSPVDFFVPPSPYSATDVNYTGRMSLGDSLGVPISTAGQIGLVVFDAAAGHRVNLKASGLAGTVAMNRPDGTALAGVAISILPAYTEPQLVPVTGTYTVVVDPTGTGTGTTTVVLYDVPPDVTGPIPTTGANTPVSLLTPGQNAHLTFDGTSGQRVSLKEGSGPSGSLRIGKPDGSTLAATSLSIIPTFIDTATLPVAGTYTVDLDPTSGNTGSVTLNLYDVPADLTGTIVLGGSPVGLTFTTPGQNGALTFSGTAGQRMSLKISSGPSGSVQVLRPNGSLLASGSMGFAAAFIDTTVLPDTGTYTIAVNPSGSNTGSVTLTLYEVPADLSGTLTVNGGAIPVDLGTPGQNGAFTFSGTSGVAVTVRVTSNTMGSVTVKLLKPDGSLLTSSTSSLGSFNLTQQTLPATGTYTVLVDPVGAAAGSLNLSATNP